MMRSLTLAPSRARATLSRACCSNGSKAATAVSSIPPIAIRRTFTSLPQLRPSILPTTSTVFRPTSTNPLSRLPTTTEAGVASAEVLDLVPKTAITAHPALAGVQIRCGPRPTLARSSRLIRKRRHGFLSRLRSRNGRKTLQRRKDKKRSRLSY
ncbi:hypothetical protein F4779DRAFT_574930 [Xylariaceae sp. FL0662B]|nr:hypothetical protein F4779DRAFT_574930 [Xylariaceae sp. FL0662B]